MIICQLCNSGLCPHCLCRIPIKLLGLSCLTLLQTLLYVVVELGYIYTNPRVSSSIAFYGCLSTFYLIPRFPILLCKYFLFVYTRTVQAASNLYMAWVCKLQAMFSWTIGVKIFAENTYCCYFTENVIVKFGKSYCCYCNKLLLSSCLLFS